MELAIEVKQKQILSPQMVQSMEILQMGTQELVEYIEDMQMENPTLEEVPAEIAESPPSVTQQEWDSQNHWYDQQDWSDQQARPSFDRPDRPMGAERLEEYLITQLDFLKIDSELEEAVRAVIGGLNHWGYLEEGVDSLSQWTGLSVPLLEDGLKLVQRLEPAGVGALNLQHCLTLQLERLAAPPLALALVEDYLPQLAQSHFHQIAQQTGTSREAVQAAVDWIRRLNPKPGAAFGGWETVRYVLPDLYILEGEEGCYVQLGNGRIPTLTVSPLYRRMAEESEDEAVQTYLTEKLRRANWLIQGISQRQETLYRCGVLILERQQCFFQGQGGLRPLLLRDMAEALDIHESTVSRALREKYLQCSRGVFPLSHFLSRNVGGEEETTHHQIKAQIQHFIQEENPKKPLSDQKICDLLKREGQTVARRTVAKYREAMGIPAAPGRRIL